MSCLPLCLLASPLLCSVPSPPGVHRSWPAQVGRLCPKPGCSHTLTSAMPCLPRELDFLPFPVATHSPLRVAPPGNPPCCRGTLLGQLAQPHSSRVGGDRRLPTEWGWCGPSGSLIICSLGASEEIILVTPTLITGKVTVNPFTDGIFPRTQRTSS